MVFVDPEYRVKGCKVPFCLNANHVFSHPFDPKSPIVKYKVTVGLTTQGNPGQKFANTV